jgi:tRNA nucleotidyltransferase/poly(A) polymerase
MKDFGGFPFQYKEILDVIKPSGAFLVGGAVRDRLLNKPVRDLDFALPGDVVPYAKEVADRLDGDYYLLDRDRGAARVILRDPSRGRLIVDFTRFQGETIQDDLFSRDFTITSMAMDVNQDHILLDPFRGAQDLKDGLLRSTTDHSLMDDPLRCIRAVRMAAQLGFKILPDTKEQIREVKDLLSEVSAERIRDEVFRILDGPYQGGAMHSLQVLGIYKLIFSTELTQDQIRILRKMADIWNLLQENHDQEAAANWAYGLISHRLGRYREQIQAHLRHEPVPGRSVYQLSMLLPLMLTLEEESSDPGLETGPRILAGLSLSNQERYQLEKGYRGSMQFRDLTKIKENMEPIDAYCFFRDYGPAGIEGIFLGMANFLASKGGSLQEAGWQEVLDSARFFLRAWWEKHEDWVSPPLLVNGDDIQSEFNLEPGPRIGIILEKLKEAQVEEGIRTKEQALEYLKSWLDSEGFEVL